MVVDAKVLGRLYRAAVGDEPAPHPLQPLSQRNIVPITAEDGVSRNAVNFNYILETGKIPSNPANVIFRDYYVDFNSDDRFTRALKTVEERTVARIEQSPELEQLLRKPQWTKQDHQTWESKVSNIISQEVDKIPGMQAYRNSNYEGITRNPNLNEFSDTTEFDCEVSSIVEGITMQKMENRFLPQNTAVSGDYKYAQSYFYASGGYTNNGNDTRVEGHAYIFTPTGNVIEGTADPSQRGNSYKVAINGNSLEQYVKGRPVVTEHGAVYGSWDNVDRHQRERDLASEEAAGEREDGRIYSREQLFGRERQNRTTVAEAPQEGLIMVASKVRRGGNDDYEVKVYQRQNIGTPQEGYTIVGYSHALKPPGADTHVTHTFIDRQTGEKYKFDADFSSSQNQLNIYKHNGDRINIFTDGFRRVGANTERFEQRPAVTPPAVPPVSSPRTAQPVREPSPVVPPPATNPVTTPAGTPQNTRHNEPPDMVQARGVQTLQQKLGVTENGFGQQTNSALAGEIARVQMSDAYKQIHAQMYGGNPADVKPDLMPGPATLAAMQRLGYDQQMIQAMKDLKLDDANQHNDLYHVPDNPHGIMAAARDSQTTLAATIAHENAVQTAGAQPLKLG